MGTGFPPKVRQLIHDRSGGRCEIQMNVDTLREEFDIPYHLYVSWRWRGCLGAEAVHCHHRRNRGAGSTKRPETNRAANGLHACVNCHEWVGAHPAMSYRAGWLVRQQQVPAEVPVLYRGSWFLLTDDGGLVDQEVPFGEVS